MSQTVVIIGYGTAAVNAVIALRSAGYSDAVIVLSNTNTLPYSPVITSHYAGGTKTYEDCFPWSEEELASLNMQVVQGATVTALDVEAHTVTATTGTYAYDKCIIASGATPQVTSFPAVEGMQPLTLRTMDDAEKLLQALTNPECQGILVSGTSMVGLKTVEACLDRQVPVTLLGRSEHILKVSAMPEIAAAYEQALVKKGVDLRLSQAAEEVELVDGLIRVTFSNGDVMDFNEVVVAHGVKANLDFVAEGSLVVEKGVVVDNVMRSSNPDVYAAGDVAQAKSLVSEGTRVAGLWKDAAVQGACAGRAIAAELAGQEVPAKAEYAGVLPNNSIEVCGTVLISGGTIAPALNRWEEMETRNGCLIGRVFEHDVETETSRLVGFNVFSNNADPLNSPVFDEGAMLYRRLLA